MRILALSDIHDRFAQLPVANFPDADVCLIAGDLTNTGRRNDGALSAATLRQIFGKGIDLASLSQWAGAEMTRARIWLEELALRFPIFWIPGNHDIGVDNSAFADIPNCVGILNRTVEFGGYRIHGVSMSPCYDSPYLAADWDYMTADEATEQQAYDFEPVDIVVSHSPPYECQDTAGYVLGEGMRHIGSRALRLYIETHQPILVLCGHVHEAHGLAHIGETAVYNLAQRWQIIELAE